MRVDLERPMLAVSDRERRARSCRRAKGVLGAYVPVSTGYGAVLFRAAGCCGYNGEGDFVDGEVRAVQSRAACRILGSGAPLPIASRATSKSSYQAFTNTKPFHIWPHRYGIASTLHVHASPETNSDTTTNISLLASGVFQHIARKTCSPATCLGLHCHRRCPQAYKQCLVRFVISA
jgi:hypothetical protein